MILLKIALRNIFRHRSRSLITLLAIASGCIAIMAVGGFFEDLLIKMRESYILAHSGHIQVYRKGFQEHGAAEPFKFMIEDGESVKNLLSTVPGVRYVTRRANLAGLIGTGTSSVPCFAQGIEAKLEPTIKMEEITHYVLEGGERPPLTGASMITAGEALADDDKPGVILGGGLARALDAKVGSSLVLLTNTVDGALNGMDVTVRGTFQTSAKEFDDHAVRLVLATAQDMLQTKSVHSLVVMLNNTDDTDSVKAAIERVISDQKLPLEVRTWRDLSDFYTKTEVMFGSFYLVLLVIVAVVVVFSIFNTMSMSVMERTAEIGTIMAIGTKRRQVVNLFMLEGILLGAIGSLLGIVLGSCLVSLVGEIGIPMPPPPGSTLPWLSEPIVVPSTMATAALIALTVSVISSVYPAFRSSRLEIAQALRHSI